MCSIFNQSTLLGAIVCVVVVVFFFMLDFNGCADFTISNSLEANKRFSPDIFFFLLQCEATVWILSDTTILYVVFNFLYNVSKAAVRILIHF